jgi:uncharacterized membrane protein YkoI
MFLDRVTLRRSRVGLCSVQGLLLGLGLSFCALQGGTADERIGQDEIRTAVRRGEMRSLSEIEDLLRDKLPGEAIKVEIEREHGRWIYEFKVLDRGGQRFDVYVDARTGEILETTRK